MKEIAGVRIPDSDICRKAASYVRGLSPPVLYNHCLRTYVFGALVAKSQGAAVDEELLYLGAVMHDLGLTDRFNLGDRFEVRGADAANAFLREQGIDEHKREIVWDAIALHTSIGIAIRKRPEIAFVHVGAGVDVVGIALDAFPPEAIEEILDALPREDFKTAFQRILLRMLEANPASAMQTFLEETARSHIHNYDCPTFLEALQSAPFRE